MKAIWLIDDEELYLVEPVEEIFGNEDIKSIQVYNGHWWYNADDCEAVTGRFPNRFMLVPAHPTEKGGANTDGTPQKEG